MKELIAPEGFIYRNIFDYDVYGRIIYLGINDSEDNWELIKESIEEINI